MRCCVIADIEHDGVSSATLSTITAARQLGEVDLLLPVAPDVAEPIAAKAATLTDLARVRVAAHPHFSHPVAEDLSALTLSIAEQYEIILTAATSFGKNFLPRVAAQLDVAQISDVIRIDAADTFVRPIYAGNALITVQSKDRQKVLTIRPTAFEPAQYTSDSDRSASIEALEFTPPPIRAQFHAESVSHSDRPELGSAKIVVSGGRGLKSKDNFQLIEDLADRLGAALGASRAAVDAGFINNDHQVGQTGKIVAPDLYFAIGISGAIQHVAGIKDSKVIVAINKDPDAPIFEVADYGLVADFFTVLPELEAGLDELGYHKK